MAAGCSASVNCPAGGLTGDRNHGDFFAVGDGWVLVCCTVNCCTLLCSFVGHLVSVQGVFVLKSFAITYWILLQGCADSRREVCWLGCFTRHPGLPCVQPVRMKFHCISNSNSMILQISILHTSFDFTKQSDSSA